MRAVSSAESELGLRPIYDHKAIRAHILLSPSHDFTVGGGAKLSVKP